MIRLAQRSMLCVLLFSVCCIPTLAEDRAESAATGQTLQNRAGEGNHNVKQLLLLGQSPDGHPWGTHEYMAGLRVLSQCLEPVEGVQITLVKADEPFKQGPQLIDASDGVVVFLSQGARWIHQNPARLKALKRLAKRGGGLVALHWGMGGKDARYIDEFVKLFGGCHGGPDRKYKVVTVTAKIAAPAHPIMQGIEPFEVHDEFYYRLKLVRPAEKLTPLLKVPIEGEHHTVALAWERPDGGRSFAFSGGHFHENWRLEEYRRMVTQAVLWSMKVPIPEDGLPLKFSEKDLRFPRPKPEPSQ